jgi:hypothetical protein
VSEDTDTTQDICPTSERVDGPRHSWRFDGDDPRIICVYCGEMRDALTGNIIRSGHGEPAWRSSKCICDPMRGITCAGHAEQARAAREGRPMVDETAARAAGWVPLAEVLEALREMDPVEAALAGQHAWEDAARILAERFSDKEATPDAP